MKTEDRRARRLGLDPDNLTPGQRRRVESARKPSVRQISLKAVRARKAHRLQVYAGNFPDNGVTNLNDLFTSPEGDGMAEENNAKPLLPK